MGCLTQHCKARAQPSRAASSLADHSQDSAFEPGTQRGQSADAHGPGLAALHSRPRTHRSHWSAVSWFKAHREELQGFGPGVKTGLLEE